MNTAIIQGAQGIAFAVPIPSVTQIKSVSLFLFRADLQGSLGILFGLRGALRGRVFIEKLQSQKGDSNRATYLQKLDDSLRSLGKIKFWSWPFRSYGPRDVDAHLDMLYRENAA